MDDRPIDADQLSLLRCPRTQSALSVANAELLAKLNRAIQAGKVRDPLGRLVEDRLEGGLVNADRSVCYPIRLGTLQLLVDESIPLSQLGD